MLLKIVSVVKFLGVNVGMRRTIAATSQAAKPVAATVALPEVVQAGF